jgi:aminopeptidase N
VPAADVTGAISVRQQGVLSSALAHQWFGASVTPARWQDVWLSEGFSTYARWMWMQRAGLQRVDDAAANALVRSDALRKAFGPPDAPTAATLFSPAVVDGGAVVLQALRATVGDATFFSILRRWVSTYAGRAVTTDTFIDHVSDVVGRDMTDFFMTWLSATDVPDAYPATTG